MRKPPTNFKRSEKKATVGGEELFELCWYDSLVDRKNIIDKAGNE